MKDLFKEIPTIKRNRLTLKAITLDDAEALGELVANEKIYRYLPTFLYELRYDDVNFVIEHMYDDKINDSLFLGIYLDNEFCGIAELYGYNKESRKISVGYRFLERCWGHGIAEEELEMLTDYLFNNTDIELITASAMSENKASAHVLQKNGFSLVEKDVKEYWGYPEPILTDKWAKQK